ncbi:MAG: BamA/TamA family outer membrane protein [Bacteroidaceae bacterium]|nr:BamA/TamA family outer membrane protein [Bacteroidaceae bacterium]MBQ3187906.1 BamA/TamA family outer membrane protein [Bacteroidaceae bacterium]
MRYISFLRSIAALLTLMLFATDMLAQDVKVVNPTILYSGTPRKYEIGGINLSGVDNHEPYVIIGISGLSVGDEITVPGEDVTSALKRYWKFGLFSDVSITADSIIGTKIYLGIHLKQSPRVSDIKIKGVKKSEREDLETKIGLIKGNQITPDMVSRARRVIKRYFEEKGYKNVEINIMQRPDVNIENQVIVDVNIDKKDKIKVHKIYIDGIKAMPDKKVRYAMKKTREKTTLKNFFHTFLRSKKYTDERYEGDKDNIISLYNEHGFRDAIIVSDSVVPYNDNSVDIYLTLDEGNKYYLKSIKWVGNSVYSTSQLDYLLSMKPGDVYNQKLLDERLNIDDNSVKNTYFDNGYVFLNLLPIEVSVDNDSVELEIRMHEGSQATINRVKISGNDRLYEDVVRRELRTLPGSLFSMEAVKRSYREIAQMGHFDAEKINPDIVPNDQTGTVDINWQLVSKSSDQIEVSAGWGQTGVIGKLSLKFTNFSMRNLFRKGGNRRGIIPQGDGQTLTISAQSNGKYYQAYSVSFFDPWFGRKRPNSLSVSAFMSVQTDVASSYYNSAYYNNYYNYMYGYGNYNNYGYNNMSSYYDPDKYIKMYGFSIGWGRRLRWPDDFFTFSAELNYQLYSLKDWQYFLITDGNCNNINLSLSLSRNSVDNPLFPRRGSEFSLTTSFTPPYSMFDGKDYKNLASNPKSPTYKAELREKHKWIEYYKIKFKSKTYTSLTGGNYNLVLMTRADFGLLGSYDSYKKSPFETFYMGGDGMSGYSYNYATDMVALRGYDNGSLTPYGYEGYAYARLGMELRFPFMLQTSTNIYGLAFVEAGNSWTEMSQFNLFDLKRSAGVGVRIFLQMIGLIGIDWAYGFDKLYGSSQYGGSQFHFILGQEF